MAFARAYEENEVGAELRRIYTELRATSTCRLYPLYSRIWLRCPRI